MYSLFLARRIRVITSPQLPRSLFGLLPKPDLQVTSLGYYYDPNNPTGTGLYTTVAPGGNFVLQATVANRGTAPFPASTLAFQYYSSTSWLTSSSVPPSAWLSTGFTTTITTPIPAGSSRTSEYKSAGSVYIRHIGRLLLSCSCSPCRWSE